MSFSIHPLLGVRQLANRPVAVCPKLRYNSRNPLHPNRGHTGRRKGYQMTQQTAQARADTGVAESVRYLQEVVGQAQFRSLAAAEPVAWGQLAVPCTAVVVACFRDDGALLMVCPPGAPPAWDLPHGKVPPAANPADYAEELLAQRTGVWPVMLTPSA